MQRQKYKDCLPWFEAAGIDFEHNNTAQWEVALDDERFPLIIGGERGGKSWVTAALIYANMELLPTVKFNKFFNRNGTPKFNYKDTSDRPLAPHFVLFGPTYDEPRIEFEYIENWLRKIDDLARVSKPVVGPWRLVTKVGVVLATWSTNDPASIRGLDLEGAAACECGQMEWSSIERIQGRISGTAGFLVYSGTMEMAKRWYVRMAIEGERLNRYGVKTYSLPSWLNTSVFPGGYNDPEIQRLKRFYPEDIFQVRVAAKPVPPRDRVIREINTQHIRKVVIPRTSEGLPDARIEIAIDPGYLPSAYSVLWVASWDTPEGRFWYIFDEVYVQLMQNSEVIDKIRNHKFYKYLKSDGLTIDVSAKRHADGNEPAVVMFQKLTNLKSPFHKYWHENSLIERIRTTAKANLIAIHPNCRGLIAELGLGEEVFPEMHPWRYQSNNEGEVLNEKPKDAWNHSCKALGYVLLRHLGIVERTGEKNAAYNRLKDRPFRALRSIWKDS